MTYRTSLLAAGLIAVASVPAAASAAPAPIGAGLTVLKPAHDLQSALRRSGTHLSALRPGKYTAGVFALAVTGGRFAFVAGGGTVAMTGSLRLRHGRRSVTISRLELALGRRSSITAALDGRRMTVFTVSRRLAHASGSASGRVISGLRLTFTAMAATVIDELLSSQVLTPHGVAAVAGLIVEPTQPSATGASGSSTSGTVGSPESGAQPAPTVPGGSAGSSGPLGLPGITTGLPGLTSGLPGVTTGLPGITSGLPGLPGLPPISSLL